MTDPLKAATTAVRLLIGCQLGDGTPETADRMATRIATAALRAADKAPTNG